MTTPFDLSASALLVGRSGTPMALAEGGTLGQRTLGKLHGTSRAFLLRLTWQTTGGCRRADDGDQTVASRISARVAGFQDINRETLVAAVPDDPEVD